VAAIHRADWQGLGLGFLAEGPGTLVERDLLAVEARAETFGCRETALVARLRAQLADPPGEPAPSLVQGDINVYNYLYRGGQLVAVVDWEQAGLGDRRLDLGLIACLSMLKLGLAPHPRETPIIASYEAATGGPVHGLPWFVTFAAYKLAVIHHGWKLHNGTEPWFSLQEIERVADAMSRLDD
jgi:aminoglycoside phosphotransferase (APT) family kinase protein